jgi:hypothetical protein
MAGQFIVTRGGRDSFCSEDELRKQASKGQLDTGDLVYHPVLGRWLYAREVEEIRDQMSSARALGRPVATDLRLPTNDDAVVGFILGFLGHLPVVGFLCCLLGIYFSGRGIRRAALSGDSGHGLAIAGMVLSVVFLVPATACGALIIGSALSPFGGP